jgi:hypothetical protein
MGGRYTSFVDACCDPALCYVVIKDAFGDAAVWVAIGVARTAINGFLKHTAIPPIDEIYHVEAGLCQLRDIQMNA